jgi:hypothetical protein
MKSSGYQLVFDQVGLGKGSLTRTIVVELNGVRVREASRSLEPLRGLDTILTTTNQIDNSLGVEPSSFIDSLKEDLIQFVELGSVLSIVDRRLINRLEGNHVRLATQLGANLIPEPIELLLNHGKVGS